MSCLVGTSPFHAHSIHRSTRSDFNYLFGGDAALLPLYTLTTADYDLLLSPPPITSPLLELVWERIIPPLDRILLHSARILLVSIRANPTTEAFAIWDLAAAAFDWTDQLLALLSGDNRFWSDNKTPQNAQFTVRQIISYEQLLIWVMLAVHTTLARSPLLSDDRTSWIVLSRDKLRATVHRLANRGNTLVVRPCCCLVIRLTSADASLDAGAHRSPRSLRSHPSILWENRRDDQQGLALRPR